VRSTPIARHCDSGACRAPTFTDGVKNGYEGGVDCGTYECGGCAGDSCNANDQCKSGHCNGARE